MIDDDNWEFRPQNVKSVVNERTRVTSCATQTVFYRHDSRSILLARYSRQLFYAPLLRTWLSQLMRAHETCEKEEIGIGLCAGCVITVFVDTRLRKTKHPRKRFQNFRQIGSKSTNYSPLAWRKEGHKVTLVAVIGGFRSDLWITRKTDGNFGNVSAGVLFSKVAYQRKRL